MWIEDVCGVGAGDARGRHRLQRRDSTVIPWIVISDILFHTGALADVLRFFLAAAPVAKLRSSLNRSSQLRSLMFNHMNSDV